MDLNLQRARNLVNQLDQLLRQELYDEAELVSVKALDEAEYRGAAKADLNVKLRS